MISALISAFCLVAQIAPAQSGDASLRFEAASVKPSPRQDANGFRWGIERPPGRFRATNAPLRRLLTNAFSLKDYQIETPGWMDDARYDIDAKAPGPATKKEIDAMVQNLLIERFRIEMHREQRPTPVYRLTEAPEGAELKETTMAPEPQPATSETPPTPQAMRAMPAARYTDG